MSDNSYITTSKSFTINGGTTSNPIVDGWAGRMNWYWCKYCSSWFRASTTTVVRCPKCGADITEFTYIPNGRMDNDEDEVEDGKECKDI